jgi:hypothetical protein
MFKLNGSKKQFNSYKYIAIKLKEKEEITNKNTICNGI